MSLVGRTTLYTRVAWRRNEWRYKGEENLRLIRTTSRTTVTVVLSYTWPRLHATTRNSNVRSSRAKSEGFRHVRGTAWRVNWPRTVCSGRSGAVPNAIIFPARGSVDRKRMSEEAKRVCGYVVFNFHSVFFFCFAFFGLFDCFTKRIIYSVSFNRYVVYKHMLLYF